MGRGRAKAKQTKVARRLKYDTGGTDLTRLAEELGVSSHTDDADDEYDPYAEYADHLDDEDDEDEGAPAHRRRH